MADITNVYQTYNNAGTGVAQADDNYQKFVINQADVGRELIIKVAKTNITNAELNTIIKAITLAGGAAGALPEGENDAFTVAAVGTADGTPFVDSATAVGGNGTDVVFLRVQGTGTYAGVASNAHGVTGAVTTVEAIFTPAL